jgi:hypothetical protein
VDEKRRLQFAGWSAVVGLAAAAFSIGLFVIDYTLEASVFVLLAIVFFYLAAAVLAAWWPFTSPDARGTDS